MAKKRLDLLVVERALAESRTQAQRLIMAGDVRVDGQVVYKPATQIAADADITVEEGPRFVSRGGEKLQAALEHFELAVEGLVCADVGASTGGFTDCLIQAGAARVYAIDVAKGQLHWKLRSEQRVVPLEEVNARYLTELPEQVSLVVVDASFISLQKLIPTALGWFKPGGGDLVVLIKPQFEAGRQEVDKGKGVIRNPDIHARVVDETLVFSRGLGLEPVGWIESPILGPKGNKEFLAYMRLIPGGNAG
ncbi:MAG: TlyA family RNA methyltransferase [Anaerolineales bacterium]|nr:TlyA family RNA methyltransferase [Anaerolineales bacterium]